MELQVQTTSSFTGAFVHSVAIGEIIDVKDDEWGDYSYFSEERRIAENFSQNLFIAVYHDIDDVKLKDISGLVENLTYLGKDYFSSGVGVSSLPLLDGATYILKLATW